MHRCSRPGTKSASDAVENRPRVPYLWRVVTRTLRVQCGHSCALIVACCRPPHFFIPIKTWNTERAAHTYRPGIALADNPDNADVAGPDSVYDYYA